MPEEIVRVRLDGAQVRQIQQARQSAQRLEGELRRSEQRGARGGGDGFGSRILDRINRFETFASKILQNGLALTRAAQRLERFLALSGVQSSTLQAITRRASSEEGALSAVGRSAPFAAVAATLNPALGGATVLTFGALGAYLGSEVPEKRLEGARRVLDVENEQARADAAVQDRIRNEMARQFLERQSKFTREVFDAGFRRARRGAVR